MSSYKHILVGLDLSPESQQVIDRVKFLFSNTETKISICHILEPLAFTYGGDIPVDLSDVQTQLTDQANLRLSTLGAELDVCLLYTLPSPRDRQKYRMPSSACKKKFHFTLYIPPSLLFSLYLFYLQLTYSPSYSLFT